MTKFQLVWTAAVFGFSFLLLFSALLSGCSSSLDLAPGLEVYQGTEGPDGALVEEKTQGVRARIGKFSTETSPNSAAEKADEAAGKFQAGAAETGVAARKAENASIIVLYAALGLGTAILLLAAVLLFRKKAQS